MLRIVQLQMVVLVAMVALLGACKSSKVADVKRNHALGTSQVVVVEQFAMAPGAWSGDQGEHTAAEVQQAFAGAIVRELRERGFDASMADGSASPGGGLLVRGEIVKVDAGSGAARALVGWGAGQSKFTARADVFNVGMSPTTPACVVTVTGGSKGKGGWFAAGYASDSDAGDAAEQIAEFIATNRE